MPKSPTLDVARASELTAQLYAGSIVPTLVKYIEIPNKSPGFDPEWERNGHMRRAMDLIVAWCRTRRIAGMRLEVVQLPGRTPLLFIEVPGAVDDTVLLYGHMDKQPEITGWAEGLGPWQPVLRGDRLYGRGGADDGYSTFASLAALEVLQDQKIPHARCVVIIEGCEESGSGDLPAYVDALADRIGTPRLVICLDSGCGDYEGLWITTSLRGLIGGALTVTVLDEGVHSGAASGIVPSSFRIARQLLARLEDERTGAIRIRALHVEVPDERIAQVKAAAAVLGSSVHTSFPFASGMRPVDGDVTELLLNRTWRPQLEIIAAGGLPSPEHAGNVLRPRTSLKLSLRLPPTLPADAASTVLHDLLTADPPYGAQVSFVADQHATGWNAPPLEPWLEESVARASREHFGHDVRYQGEGGTIPFMAMLGERFPHAQFVITGVLGPHANAHGPNEFLELATGARVTTCVARVLADQYHAPRQ